MSSKAPSQTEIFRPFLICSGVSSGIFSLHDESFRMNPSTIAIFTEKRAEKQGRKMATSRSDGGFNEVSEPCSDNQEDYDFAVISRLWRDSSLKLREKDDNFMFGRGLNPLVFPRFSYGKKACCCRVLGALA